MNDKFLQRLNKLESELSALKEDYINEKNSSQVDAKHRNDVVYPATIHIKAPPVKNLNEPVPTHQEEPIPLKSRTPVNTQNPIPPEPRDDIIYPRTIHIKAPPSTSGTPEESQPKSQFQFPDRESQPRRFRFIVEMFIGARLVGTIGIVLLMAAICYGVVYAYQHYNPPPELKVAGACLASLLISGLGFGLRGPKYRFLALLLKGGGLGGLYISVWAGFHFYGLFGSELAGLLLMGVAGLIFTLSWWENSQVIGIFATTGAFLMPLLVRTPDFNHLFFCLYLLCVNLPVIFLGLKRNWQVLYNLGFIFSILLGGGWSYRHIGQQSPIIVLFWGGLAVEYIALNLLKLNREADQQNRFYDYARLVILTLMLVGVFSLDGMTIEPLWLYLGATALYAVTATVCYRLKPWIHGEMVLFIGGTAAFLALAIPEIFNTSRYVYLAWSCESLALAALGAGSRSRAVNRCANALAAITLFAVWYDIRGVERIFTRFLFLNGYFIIASTALGLIFLQALISLKRIPNSFGSKIIMVAGVLGMVLLVGQNSGLFFNWNESWLLLAGLTVAVFGLSFCYLALYVKEYHWLRDVAVVMFIILLIYAVFPANVSGSPWLLVLWPLGGLLWFWILPRGNMFRFFAILLCLIAIGKCFRLQHIQADVFFNAPFLAALVSGAAFLALNWIPPWQRPRDGESITGLNPHLVSWSIITFCMVFCWNFIALQPAAIDTEMRWLGIEFSMLAIPVMLGVIGGTVRDRRYAHYFVLIIMILLSVLWVDIACGGTGKPAFIGIKLYLWLLIPAMVWMMIVFCRRLLCNREIILVRLFSGSVFIYIIYRELSRLPNESYAKAFSLIFLTAAAVFICAVGLWKRRPAARYYSFFLLTISISQLFVQSLFKLKDPARIIAFLALGILLLGLSWGYHKVSRYLENTTPADENQEVDD